MQTTVKILIKLNIFSAKVLEIQIKVIPLHPLSRTNETSSETRLRRVREQRMKKEFFEKIYIRQKSSTRSENEEIHSWVEEKQTVKFV